MEQHSAHPSGKLCALSHQHRPQKKPDGPAQRYADKRGNDEYAICLDELDESLSAPGSLEAALETKELAECINRFLSRLSETDRKIFMCRYWLAAPVSEIAGRLGSSESKVKSSLFRSRSKLKNYLENNLKQVLKI